MYAQLLDGYGNANQFRYAEVETPTPGAGQVLVKNVAIGVNAMEWKIRSGQLKDVIPLDFPAILGTEIAGTVSSVGEGVTAFAVGDRVVGRASSGAYAEYSLAEADALTSIPAEVRFDDAVSLPIAVNTVNRFIQAMQPERGQTVVINGASGSVGTAAIQLLREMGVGIIGTASTANLGLLTELGAAPVRYGDGSLEAIREQAQHGVDLVFDVAGYGFAETAVELTGDPKKVLTIADFGAVQEFGIQTTTGGGPTPGSELDQVLAKIVDGSYGAVIDTTHALADVAAALERSEAGHVRGKIVLNP